MPDIVPIIPGSMLTDVAENLLKFSQHQEVINLKQNKLNEWETVRGYITVNDPNGLSSIKNGIEVSDDLSGDRFILFQNGVLLYRIDYDVSNSPITGYENETHVAVTLPTGVLFSIADIAAGTAKFRFFYFRGIVRISGANEPLWYGNIDRTLFNDSGTPIVLSGWYLERASLHPATAPLISDNPDLAAMWYGDDEVHKVVFVKVFNVYDESQYSLMAPVDSVSGHTNYFDLDEGEVFINTQGNEMTSLRLAVQTIADTDANQSKRITGIGIAYSVVDISTVQAIKADEMIFYVREILPMFEDLEPIIYSRPKVYYDTANPNVLELNHDFGAADTDKDDGLTEEGYIYVGVGVLIRNGNNSLTTTITAISFLGGKTLHSITLDDPVFPNLIDSNVSDYITEQLASPTPDSTGFTIYRKWVVSGDFYKSYVCLDLSLTLNEFNEFTEIPSGTIHITPNYSHHAIIEDRPYCLSKEDEEEDVVRYGPLFQLDSFPIGNVIQTQVGDVDRNLAIVKRDDRLIILKRNSFSQISFSGTRYSEDIGLKDNGLFATDGYLLIDNTLFWMDKEDIYFFGGVQTRPLMVNQLVRNIYKTNVTTSSILLRNKIDNELWAVLSNGVILVYSFDRKNWYQRQTDQTLLFGLLDSDKRLIAGANGKFVLYNHSETTFNELMNWSFTTRIYDRKTPDYFKKAKILKLLITGNGVVTVTIQDDVEARSFSEDITPATTNLEVSRLYPKYLFKRADIKVESKTASFTQQATIGISELQIESWK